MKWRWIMTEWKRNEIWIVSVGQSVRYTFWRLRKKWKWPPTYFFQDSLLANSFFFRKSCFRRNVLFYSLLSFIKDGTQADDNAIETAGRQWLRDIASCGNAGIRGFSKDRLTPYAHLVGTHAWNLVRQIGGIQKFSGKNRYRTPLIPTRFTFFFFL